MTIALRSRSNRHNARHGSAVVMIVALVMICAFFAALMPAVITQSNESSNRIKCAQNLHQLGQALLLYSNENNGAFPRTKYHEAATVVPDLSNGGFDSSDPFSIDTTVPLNCVPSSMFLLLRTEDIVSSTFCCPSTSAQPDTYGGGTNSALNRCNFTDVRANLSYSYANPFPDVHAVHAGYKLNVNIDPAFAVMADKNPGIGPGSDVTAVTLNDSAAMVRRGNSLNHNRDGQNILFADVHVEFDNTPFAGIDRDNIYCRRGATDINGVVNSPLDKKDSVLLPVEGN